MKPALGVPSAELNIESDRGMITGWVVLIGWWISAYLLTIDLQGWVFTELATLKAGSLSFTDMLANRATYGHCPLYFVLTWVIQKTLGENPIALRLPTVVFGLLSALVIFRMVRRWTGRRAAVFTGLIVLLSPFLLQVSQQARPYPLALLFGLIATEIILDSTRVSRHRKALWFGIVSLLGLLTSHAYWFVLAAHILGFLGNARRQAAMIVAAVAAAIGALPWLLYAKYWAESGGKSERFLTWMGPVELTTSLALPGRLVRFASIGPDSNILLILVVTMVTIVLAGVGLAALPKVADGARSAPIRWTLACLWIAPPFAALVAGLLGWGNLLLVPRYFAVTAIVQLVLIAWAVWTVRPTIRPAAMIVLGLGLAGSSVLYLSEIGRDEIRRSARIIEAEWTRGEAIIVISLRSDVRLFKHYLSAPVIGCLVNHSPGDDSEISDENFPEYRGRKRGAWIAVSRESGSTSARGRNGFFDINADLASFSRDHLHQEGHAVGKIDLFHFTERIPSRGSPDRADGRSISAGSIGARSGDPKLPPTTTELRTRHRFGTGSAPR